MGTAIAESLVEQRIRETAREYQAKGYDVICEPGPEQLPEFLKDLRPDILARNGHENVVIEVKTTPQLSHSTYLQDIARRIEGESGWRLELVVVNPEREMAFPIGAYPLDQVEVIDRLHAAEQLQSLHYADAAILQAWAATEAALRIAAVGEGIELDRAAPLYLIKQLATQAVISQEDYRLLMQIIDLRNAIAHGMKPTRFTDMDPIQYLKELCLRLFQESATV